MGIRLYSDPTHLTNFSHASMWPIYVYVGHQSKYERARPSAATAAVLTFLCCELMQQILLLLLDVRLMYIYVHVDGLPVTLVNVNDSLY